MNFRYHITLIVVSSFLFISNVQAWGTGLPNVPVPHNSKLAWVSNSINHNGVVMSIQSFHSPDNVSQVMDFYRLKWASSSDEPGFMENQSSEWNIISQIQKDHHIVLQLKSGLRGGSEGFLSIASKDGIQTVPDHGIPVPGGAKQISSSYVEENNTEAHTNIYLTADDVGSTASFYRSRMKGKGWVLAHEERVKQQYILMFDRMGDRVELVVGPSESKGSIIFVNKVSVNG